MDPTTLSPELQALKTKVEGALQIAKTCPHEAPRQTAIGNLNNYSEQLWSLAANDPALFAHVKAIDDLIEPAYRKKNGRGPAAAGPARAKQLTPEEVRKTLAGISWDGIGRLDDEGYWKKVLGVAATFRDGSPDGKPAALAVRDFMLATIRRLFKAGSPVMPLVLVGDEAAARALRLSPSCLPAPYKTSVGHLVPSRASLVTVFDGLGNNDKTGPFAAEDTGTEGTLARWFSSVSFIKRPTTIAELVGYILCQGDAPGVADIDQAWAEAYRCVYDEGGTDSAS